MSASYTLPFATEKLRAAITLIARVPGYAATARGLTRLLESDRLRFVPDLIDRGEAKVTGTLLIGPEAVAGSLPGLAETLVHEQFHRTQPLLAKTASFWAGVATGTPVMRRYERPAYEAAVRFLTALATACPEYAAEAEAEIQAIRQVWDAEYGGRLD